MDRNLTDDSMLSPFVVSTRQCALRVVVVLAALSAVVALALFTADVHVAELGVDGEPAFCGSAYDVALIKHDGYMGGELPANQPAIDRACLTVARRDLGRAWWAAGAAVLLGGCAVALRLRARSRTGG